MKRNQLCHGLPPSLEKQCVMRRLRAFGMAAATAAMFALFSVTAATAQTSATSMAAAPTPNIARGAPYVLWPAPDYPHCTDPGDATQLTDGELTQGHFWMQPTTVGWLNARYVTITIDLGKSRAISGLSFRTAAGAAGVGWPATIRVHLSEDGKTYRDLGDLMELREPATLPPPGYAVLRLATSKLKAHGRFVRLMIIPTGSFIFADEIEVFGGDESLPASVAVGSPVPDLEKIYLHYQVGARVRRRFVADTQGLGQAIAAASLDAATKKSLTDRLDKASPRLMSTINEKSLETFQGILPLNETHAEVFGVQAALWNALGRPALSAWAACPWDPMDHLATPPEDSGVTTMDIHTMRGEYRAAAFNLANASDRPMQISFHLEGIPGGPTPTCVTVHRVPWTDTASGRPVAAALVDVKPAKGQWRIDLLPGLVGQVWLNFHVTQEPAGRHAGRVVVSGPEAKDITLPLALTIYPPTFPARTTLQVGGWSYTDGPGMYSITPANHKQFVDHLRSRFVNTPWATAAVMNSFTFFGETPQLDTKRMDDWIAEWPDAQAYMVFLSVGRTFAGQAMGTPAFTQRVGSWISAWVDHLAQKGIAADRLGLLLVDEPREPGHEEVFIPWAKAIRAAQPKVLIWEDPIYKKPQEGRAELFEHCTVLCPNRPMWLAGGKPFEDFYLAQQKAGRGLQFYSCSGPARLLDPYAYYRLQAWHCWKIGATGSFFWAFGDGGKASSWNEYSIAGAAYTPLFLDDQSVTAGKQMEAIRESAEDYEYFIMLKNRVADSGGTKRPAAVEAGRKLLNSAADEVLQAQGAKSLSWHAPKDRSRADVVRIELLKVLTELSHRE